MSVLMTSLLNESPTDFDSIIENALPWVMGQVFSGSHGSWVTRSDPSPTLEQGGFVALS